jgi:hypothetical protein
LSKGKVRFVAIADGQPRRLFSVRELPDGGLLVVLHGEDNRSHEIGAKPSPLLESRISVHPSPTSHGTTITNHSRTSGSYHKDASFIHDSKDYLLWPLFARHCPDLRHDRYLANAALKDVQICICDPVPRFSSLTYVVFAARANYIFPTVAPYSCHVHNFGKFSLGIYVSYSNLPPIHASGYSGFTSSPDKVPPENRTLDGFKSFAPAKVGFACFSLLEMASIPVIAEFQAHIPAGTEERKAFDELRLIWTTRPIETDGAIELLGSPDPHLGLPTMILRQPLDE